MHRYEHGYFWPNLAESNFNYIGKGEGVGYNINVPLNVTGLRDDDYLAVVFYLLLPVAYEVIGDAFVTITIHSMLLTVIFHSSTPISLLYLLATMQLLVARR